MSALPLFKIGVLAVRTLAKPVATSLKDYAKNHVYFRQVCASTGQAWHQIVSRINIRLQGHKISKVKPLGEADAVARGADFFGEFFIYSVSVVAVVVEVRRSELEKDRKAREKAERQVLKENRFRHQIRLIDQRMDQIQRETTEVRELVEKLQAEYDKSAQSRWPWLRA